MKEKKEKGKRREHVAYYVGDVLERLFGQHSPL